jgi:predicted dehydrogenase
MRIGVWSLAHMHAMCYLACLSSHQEVTWAGLMDEDEPERAQAVARDHGLHWVESADELLEQVDAVIITSANADHARMALCAAEAGVHALVEKPVAADRVNALAMIDAFARRDLVLGTAFPCPFSPAFQALQEQVAAGALGDILALRTTNRGSMPGGFFIELERSGGGAVIDHAVHVADLLRRLTASDPVRVYAEVGHGLYHEAWDDSGLLSIDMASGAVATLDTSWSRPKSYPTWGDVTIQVIGSQGNAYADLFVQHVTHYPHEVTRPRWISWGSDLDSLMVDDFITAVRDGRAPRSTGHDGLRALEVALAAYASAGAGQPVEIASL